MDYSPPPLFKQGAPARVKVTVAALVSLTLLVVDARMHVLNTVRQVAATVLYPLQMAALMPRDAVASMGGYFSSLSSLQNEVRELKNQQVAQAQSMQQAQLQMAENAHLRRLLEAREHLPVQSIMGEILYDARDPSTRRIVLDRGARSGVQLGLPVIDNAGVIGQVTRVFPFTSEVTLLTDKEQAIPVQVLRSGLRSIAYGRGRSGLLDLRFVAPDADIQVGDVIVTSGLDGMYPAGLAVAKVVQVEKVAAGAFGRVVCQPLGGVDRNRQLLIVMSQVARAPRPADPSPAPAHGAPRRNLPKMEPVPLPPLAAAPLPAQGAPTQPGANTPAGAGGTPPVAPSTTPSATPSANPALTPPAATRPAAPPAATVRPAAPPSAAVTPPAQPAIRKEGA
ncbi:rod shape-determining protein MreC [Massilia sp. Leaf139]|uniref:rod shape-determining protein MreC n=1 Tax=Massilia sp. Leaf139 TaxID=1736272 RepID=UPI0006F4454A|nr:rod shape-determining protein MreC [Massilia sp. Leaf139]KQQ92008.1 rod shape-determining protein MreC [Massilia sp. Leaf139]